MKKNILLITLEFPPQKGGIARYLENLVKSLKSQQVIILAPQIEKNNFLGRYKIYRKKIFFSFPLFWPKWLPLFGKIYSILRKEKIEFLVISHLLPLGYPCFVFKKIFGIP